MAFERTRRFFLGFFLALGFLAAAARATGAPDVVADVSMLDTPLQRASAHRKRLRSAVHHASAGPLGGSQ